MAEFETICGGGGVGAGLAVCADKRRVTIRARADKFIDEFNLVLWPPLSQGL